MRVNNCTIAGNLCADPESREVGEHVVASFRIANDYGKDKVSFISVECWNRTAETVIQFLEKGSGVVVSGQLITDTYEHNGQKKSKAWIKAHSVEFLPRTTKNEHSSFDADSRTNGSPQSASMESQTPF
jgi:single-strand DNA-binding protein